jgi:hypothetical protein
MASAIATVLITAVAGCAKMDAALGQQYIVVQFAPNTTLAAARHVTATCAHIPDLHLQPVKAATAHADIVESATYNTTSASPADLARLQMCLQRFRSVQGITPMEPGD